MDLDIRDRTALVTGAGRGIGRAIALTLAEEGVRVALVSRAADRVQELRAEIVQCGGRAMAYAADLGATDADVATALVQRVAHELGPPLLVVLNAAATLPFARFEHVADADFDAAVAANLNLMRHVTKACIPGMRAAGFGRIVGVSSVVASVGGAGQAAYATAKAAMLGFLRSLALELGAVGVTANAVLPGAIDTERLRAAVAERTRERIVRRCAVPRLGRTEDVAAAVAFLCSPRAAYITGAALPVAGGFDLNAGL